MASSERQVVVGVDVGGTNTDAVLVQLHTSPPLVVSSAKCPTTSDITSGIQSAIANAICKAKPSKTDPLNITQVNIGTTHFVNALVQRKQLAKVAVIRLCGPASRSVPPFSDFNDNLRDCINGGVFMVNGGYEFDGRVIRDIAQPEIQECVEFCIKNKINNFVVSGIFSPVNSKQEEDVRRMIEEINSSCTVTLSSELGQIGLLERENAAILNECLKPLSKQTIEGFYAAIRALGLNCPFYLTQNDGTLVDEKVARNQPVRTFASGPTNSMRGAAFLSGMKDAIVVDIGGTTTDIGVLRKGFPREASSEVKVGGIRTNFRMPDVLSIGLGGGSYVSLDPLQVGPQSAGYNLLNEAMVFGKVGDVKNRCLTATDVAVAAKLCIIGSPENVSHIRPGPAIDKIRTMVEESIDQVKISSADVPVVLVGGGTILLDSSRGLRGASEIVKPLYCNVANAVGAALSQVSACVDKVYAITDFIDQLELSNAIEHYKKGLGENASQEEKEVKEMEIHKSFLEKAREYVLNETKATAVAFAIKSGADEGSIEMVEKHETPLSYIPGNTTRIQIKVVGDLRPDKTIKNVIHDSTALERFSEYDKSVLKDEKGKQRSTVTGSVLGKNVTFESEDFSDPYIDPNTGEWILSTWDVECISIGAGILGCGGGGSPYMGRLLAKMAIKEGKIIRVITPEVLRRTSKEKEDVDGKARITVPIALMGAPVVLTEKLVSRETVKSLMCLQELYLAGYSKDNLPSGVLSENGVQYIQDYSPAVTLSSAETTLGKQEISALVIAEIGGLNCIEPLLVSAELGIPVIDSDGMGRAFPEIQMFCPLIYGALPYPSTLADDKGRRDVVLKADTATAVENYFRKTVVEMGCSAGLTISSLRVSDELDKLVPYSLSQAWRLGRAVLLSRHQNTSPVDAIREECNGYLTITGKITDVRRETTGGFNRGFVRIEGIDNFTDKRALIEFQNENLITKIGKVSEPSEKMKVVACVPDLITIVDNDTGEPIPTDNVRYGQRVAVLTLPSHHLLRTPEALEFIGPRAFGYEDITFIPCGPPKDYLPVGPR